MTSTRDVQHRVQPGPAGEPAAPRVIRLPSPRRLLRPGPTLVLLALLVGTASAPQGPATRPADRPGRAPAAQASVTAPGASRWYEEVVRRDPPGSVGAGTAGVQAPRTVLLPMAPAALESPAARPGAAVDVRAELWAAYRHAAAAVPTSCHLDPRLLAAIGQVESGSLAGRTLDARHRAVPPVLGPVLDGAGFARIPDTDGGRLDGDPVWDRAVGPMQFIPSTWARWGRDADGDGVADPQDVEDAALSAAAYLCAGGRDLAERGGLRAAVLSYNHSDAYLAMVLGLLPRMAPGAPGSVLVAVAPAVWTAAATVEPSVVQPPPSRSPVPTASTPTRTAGPTRTAAAGPTTTTARPTTASPTTAPTSSTTATSATSTSTTGTTSPTTTAPASSTTTASASPTSTASSTPSTTASSPTTTPGGCASASTTPSAGASATSTASTTADPDPASSASPSPTCTSSPTAAATPVPSTSSATAAEATLLGDAGAAG